MKPILFRDFVWILYDYFNYVSIFYSLVFIWNYGYKLRRSNITIFICSTKYFNVCKANIQSDY